jgi:hypothetical protein
VGAAEGQKRGDWILILGGVSAAGNRRALRLASEIAEEGLAAYWIDGFRERADGADLAVEVDGISGGAEIDVLTIVERLSEADQRALLARFASVLQSMLIEGGGRIGQRFMSVPKILYKASGLGRGRRYWAAVHGELELLEPLEPPVGIAYCDDTALTAAWHLARRWPGAYVGMNVMRAL